MSTFNPGHTFRRLLSKVLAGIELHRVQTIHSENGEVVWKTRRRASKFMVATGNLYLRMLRAQVEILTTDEWLRWELAVWRANSHASGCKTGGELTGPCIRARSLVTPRLPGEPLTRVLADTSRPIGNRMQCVGWALQSLERLHGQSADWGDGLIRPISHGDATADNVIVDVSNQSACWIDFDTRHQASLDAIERHADDLRALIFSAAVPLTPSQYQPMMKQLSASYRRRNVIACLCSRLDSDCFRPNTFELAQAPLPFAALRALSDKLVIQLRQRD